MRLRKIARLTGAARQRSRRRVQRCVMSVPSPNAIPAALLRRGESSTAEHPLCAALLTLGPPGSAPPARLERAAAVVFPVARQAAARMGARFHRLRVEPDAIASQAVMRLCRAGPLRGRDEAPADDEAAGRYLRTVIKRLLLDAERGRGRDRLERAERIGHEEEGRRPVDPADLGPGAEETLAENEVDARVAAAIADADARLDAIAGELYAARNAARRGTGDALRDQLETLAAVARGELEVNALAADELRREGLDPDDAGLFKGARNKLDRRFSRARFALAEAVQAAVDAGDPPPGSTQAQVLCLRLRARTQLGGDRSGPASDRGSA
ncbi:MAG: hypothetical protein RIT45_4106 [Pseudomonadota bacterium]